uniref:Endo/exonuclease/phosphatase domain-containing protein n=1 Tax=Rodentolepis nana TaxID=102285 RepID=A0A0R3TG49_RODNA
LYLLPKYRQDASGILTGVKEGLTSHYDLIKSMGPTQDIWGYKDTNIARKETEDMLNNNPLEHIYSNKDPATYVHYNETRTTPFLLLTSNSISEHKRRKIIEDPGSGHKPVIARNEFHTSPLNSSQQPDKLCNDITNIMMRWVKKTISRGKTENYRVFWSRHLGELKRNLDALRSTAVSTLITETHNPVDDNQVS